MNITDTWEEMGLTSSVAIKGREPAIPLPLGRFRLLEVANHRKLETGEEAIVDDRIVFPAIRGIGNVIVGLVLEASSLVEIEVGSLDVVELKSILLKDTTNPTSLNPQQGSKENVEATTGDTNQRRRAIRKVGCDVV